MPHLDTYSGNWTTKQASHLLKRSSFGVTQKLVTSSVSLGLLETINTLFKETPLPGLPLKYQYDGKPGSNDEIEDPGAKYEESWVNAPPYPVDIPSGGNREKIFASRKNSMYAWSFLQMQNEEMSIKEKLTLFWHNHFVAQHDNPHREFVYTNLLRENSLKNFKELVKQVTVNPTMMQYLSNAFNSAIAPNENYARELLELFTIGKGKAVGNGDYTNYTEDDVVAIAKVLTGWSITSLLDSDPLKPYFRDHRHTQGDKILSHRFNDAIILENGENEYKDLIDTIFKQDECSRFITRKLYKWFVRPEITADIEINIIEPLSKIVRNNNYDIVPALKTLLASDHFFENTFCMIKSPIDLMFSVTKSLQVSAPTTSVNEEYNYALLLYNTCTDLNQSIFHHPNVAGWKAYYQEPLFDKIWINSYLLPKRLDFCRLMVTGGDLLIDNPYKSYTIAPLVPVLQIASEITNSEDPNILITELSNQLFNYPISQNQIDDLKDILIPGLPDYEWKVEYTNFLKNSSNEGIRISVENKLRNLIAMMVQMSEFQIM
ncbi:DUF1800 family protein [Polaribacter sp. Q13]|uniref:DUF1800 domain-containing protein n=1 Tax=Polaribacter sp. Q13 TaxID=2806551 RepID=UPI00193B43E9|nr:DUF1800 family protein [Polaribacter sp. Q13]QVY64884.1 DUF1800 family protein [Polaribacter sp. Q13]